MKILLVALPLRLRARISGRLKEAERVVVANAGEMLAALSKEVKLIILEEDGDALNTLKKARETYAGPLLYCARTPHKQEYLKQLQLHKVTAVLQHPIDPDELVRCAAIEMGIRVPGLATGPGTSQMAPHLAAIWRRHEAANLERAALIAEACQLGPPDLSDEELERVVRAAHQLAGTLGSFGLAGATLQAREAEELLKRAAELTPEQVARLGELARALEAQIADPSVKLPELGEQAALGTLLIFAAEHACEELVEAARQAGWRPLSTADAEGVRKLMTREQPNGLVLHVVNLQECLALLHEAPGCPVVALVPSQDLLELEGCRTLLQPAAPDAILRALQAPAAPAGAAGRRRLLAVDDDPVVLESITAMMAGLSLEIRTLGNPLAFWDTLEEVDPDLLILDLDMPFLSGLELCRAVRADPHFKRVPVLVLSAYNDAETIHRVFQAGGDDYIVKPVVGPELRMRVANRLERARAYAGASRKTEGPVAPAERPDLAIVASDDFELVAELFDLTKAGYRVEHCQQGFDELLHHLTDQVDRRPRALLLQDPDCLDVLQLLESVGVTAHTDVWIRGQLSEEEVASVFALRGAGWFPASVPPAQVRRRLLRMLRRTS